MLNKLIIWIAEAFQKMMDNGEDCWCLINLSVPCKALSDLYKTFIETDGIMPIEFLDDEKKRFYFDISCKYYQTTEDRIKASKAAYVLALITSND